MEEEIKKTRVRKKKELPPFSIEKLEGTTKSVPFHVNRYLSGGNTGGVGQIICPYTEYIPLGYVLGDYNLQQISYYFRSFNGHQRQKDLLKKFEKKKMLNSVLVKTIDYYLYNNRNGGEAGAVIRAKEAINDYLTRDCPVTISSLHASWANATIWNMMSAFKSTVDDNQPSIIRMRTYEACVGHMSLFIRGEHNEYKPHIVAAVPRENYALVKYKLLLTGEVDLRDIVIFVDREFDSTSFYSKSLRALYKSHIEPYLKTLDVLICKVPLSYIEENCLLGTYKLKTKNIFERKKEIGKLIETFIDDIAEKQQSGLATSSPSSGSSTFTFPSDAVTQTVVVGTGLTSTTHYIIGVDPFRVEGDTRDIGEATVRYVRSDLPAEEQEEEEAYIDSEEFETEDQPGVPW